MVFCLVPTTALPATQTAGSWSELQTLINQTNNLSVTLSSDISWGGSSLTVPTGKTVTLDLNGKAIDAKSNGTVLVVNGTLTIKNSGADLAGPIGVGAGPITGNIKNGKASDQEAGGILVAGGGKLVMNSGWLTNCVDGSSKISAAGGIYVSKNAVFEMTGGIITGCVGSDLLCAAGVVNYGTFTMSGNATISGSKTGYNSDGVAICNAGILDANGGTVQTGQKCVNYATVQNTEKSATVFYCNVLNTGLGTIKGGLYNYPVTNAGIITGGTFNGTVTSNGTINDGIFKGTVDNAGVVTGGTFNGTTTGIYTVTFNSGVPSQIRANCPATLPDSPTKRGYIFNGWLNGGTPYDFTQNVTQNIHLTADWTPKSYTVKFDTNGGTVAQDTMQVTYGGNFEQMPIPRYKGYFFRGWYDEQWGGRQYGDEDGRGTYTYDKTEDCTLYALWEEAPLCTVTFNPNGGTLTGAETCQEKQNERIQRPYEEPIREGYYFRGWYKDADCTQMWDFDDPIPGNMTLYAGWDILSYVIRVRLENGEQDIIINQNYGTPVTVPDDPTREGYTFIGWDIPFPAKMPAKITTITAQWTINQYTITFDTAGGSEIDPIEQDYDTAITAPDNPTKEGYAFIDWDTTVPAKMPARDMTIKALWKDIEKPTGKISLDTNEWKTLLNTITFGLFFKDTQTVTITATDNSGDAVKIEYLLSAKELTEAELASAAFTAYTAPFGIDPDNEYIIYVRLTDNAGNTDYICSDGIVLDGTSPVITGIENGKTYCEAQTVTVDEKYVDTVTVNGKKFTLDESGSFTLAPADGEQKIVVTDKAGNTAEMTVTVNDGHTFGEWTSNGDGTHTRQCTADGCTEGVETDNCTDEDKNHICDICGNIISNHEDANQDHVCDLCGKTISNHADTNNNHVCDYCGKTISNHEDADKDHVCDLCGKVITNHAGGKETCRDKAVCEVCGKAYGELDPKNHTDLKHFPAKAATEDAEGNVEYWHCDDCNKYYSDKDGTKELKKADTVTSKLPKSPQTGDNSNLMLWIALLLISGGALIGTTVTKKKKKQK